MNAIGTLQPTAPLTARRDGALHRGPSLVVVAAVHAALFVASLAVSSLLAGGTHFPSPLASPEHAAAYFAEHGGAVRAGALLQFGAAVPLGIFTASVVSRLRFFRIEVAGVFIALFGGLASSLMLAASGLVQWVLSQPGVAGAGRALHLLAFGLGGPGVVVTGGLLVAGVAVTGGLARLLPRWTMWSGIAIAIVAELSTLSLAVPGAIYLLPIARFTGLVWLVCAAALLPRARRRAGAPEEVTS